MVEPFQHGPQCIKPRLARSCIIRISSSSMAAAAAAAAQAALPWSLGVPGQEAAQLPAAPTAASSWNLAAARASSDAWSPGHSISRMAASSRCLAAACRVAASISAERAAASPMFARIAAALVGVPNRLGLADKAADAAGDAERFEDLGVAAHRPRLSAASVDNGLVSTATPTRGESCGSSDVAWPNRVPLERPVRPAPSLCPRARSSSPAWDLGDVGADKGRWQLRQCLESAAAVAC